jgi:hypothetical protein
MGDHQQTHLLPLAVEGMVLQDLHRPLEHHPLELPDSALEQAEQEQH